MSWISVKQTFTAIRLCRLSNFAVAPSMLRRESAFSDLQLV